MTGRTGRSRARIALGLLILTAHLNVHADGHDVNTAGKSAGPFTLDPLKDSLIIGTSLAVNAAALLFDHCSGGGTDRAEADREALNPRDLNPLDRMFMHSFDPALDTISTGLTLTSIAVPTALLVLPAREWTSLGLMYAESVSLTWGIKELMKTAVQRPRPYMYYSRDIRKAEAYGISDELENGDSFRSFPSGHTALAFNAAGFTSYVVHRYRPESPWTLPVSAASYSLAVASSLLRLYSGNHFAGDLVAGAVIGTATGIVVPWLHTMQTKERADRDGVRPELLVTPASLAIRLQW